MGEISPALLKMGEIWSLWPRLSKSSAMVTKFRPFLVMLEVPRNAIRGPTGVEEARFSMFLTVVG